MIRRCSLPNVALPHIGSATHETRYNMAATAVDNLIAALNGNVEKNFASIHRSNSRNEKTRQKAGF